MKKRKWSPAKYEIYDIRTGKTDVDYTNLTKDDADQWLAQFWVWAWKDCESEEDERLLSKYGMPYDKRKVSSTYCKAVGESTIKFWDSYFSRD